MSAITWIMSRRRHHTLVYVDDTPNKCLPLAVSVIWLDLYIDSSQMTISIPAAKLDEVIAKCDLP